MSNISDNGSFDMQTGKIKWGPYFAPSLPAQVTYDVAPPTGSSGPQCFMGFASFDGQDEPIGGDACMLSTIPTVSFWGVAALVGLILTGGTLTLRRRLPRGPRLPDPFSGGREAKRRDSEL